jgi:ubiquinone/menaquinone biosynthesis C-methylase UbiE
MLRISRGGRGRRACKSCYWGRDDFGIGLRAARPSRAAGERLLSRLASEPDYVALNRAQWTRVNREYTDASAHDAWAQEEITWGTCRVPELEAHVLPDVAGKDVVELGCGTAYFGAWLAPRGAKVVGVDVTPAQLDTARRMEAEFGLGLEFVEANAEETGLPAASFDLVLSEYGASIWCDPAKWLPEAARLLRPGGLLVFLRNSTLSVLCMTETSGPSETLQRPQRGLYRLEWNEPAEVEFQPSHGELVRLLRGSGFEIEDFVELFAADDAVDHEYYSSSAEWAKKWPSEEIWRVRLQRR